MENRYAVVKPGTGESISVGHRPAIEDTSWLEALKGRKLSPFQGSYSRHAFLNRALPCANAQRPLVLIQRVLFTLKRHD